MKEVRQIDDKIVTCNYNPTDKGIYKWTFAGNSKCEIYIGKTQRSFAKRTNEHIRDAVKGVHCGHFQDAWNNATHIVIEAVEVINNGTAKDYTLKETECIKSYGLNNLVNEIISYSDFFKKRKKYVSN